MKRIVKVAASQQSGRLYHKTGTVCHDDLSVNLSCIDVVMFSGQHQEATTLNT